MIERESQGRFTASIPDRVDAGAPVTDLARELVRTAWKMGNPFPCGATSTRCQASSDQEIGRAIIPAEIERGAAWPTRPYHISV